MSFLAAQSAFETSQKHKALVQQSSLHTLAPLPQPREQTAENHVPCERSVSKNSAKEGLPRRIRSA